MTKWLIISILFLCCQTSQATTIAYDGYQLATDSQLTGEDSQTTIRIYNQKKIYYCSKKKAYIAVAGNWNDIQTFLKYFEEGIKPKKGFEGKYAVLIVYLFSGEVELWAGPAFIHRTIHMFPIALGSGQDAAMAAMMCGCTAAEAINIAEQIDKYTGGKVQAVTVAERDTN